MTDAKQAVRALREASTAERLRSLHAQYYSGGGLGHAEGFEFRALILEAAAMLEQRSHALDRLEELEKEVSRLRWQRLSDTPPNDFDPSMLPTIPTKGGDNEAK